MKNRQRRRLLTLVAPIICSGAAGCATVKPWDRDLLAKPEMQFVTCPQLNAIDEHVYFSKEASLGGSSLAGGGCGCN
jgi:hypothetical protein